MELSQRAEILLKALIERYIADGQPVGSRTLAMQAGLELSPATVRSVMSDLEDLGLISSLHTSSGRVPTDLGYRLFVDTLLKVRPLDVGEVQRLESSLSGEAPDPQHLVESASSLLSQLTRFAGVVMAPRCEQVFFRQIEFLALAANRVLVILVMQDGQVHNRIIQTQRAYTPAELTEASNYFNQTYAGVALAKVRHALLHGLQQDGEAMQQALRTALEVARQAFVADRPESELVVSGESNLLEFPELGDIETLRRLFTAFNAKRDLLHLLDQSLHAEGVKVFIGRESGYRALEECSVVAASYQRDGEVVGTLGVIGPMRMPYDQVISVVDITARLLGGALSAEGRIRPAETRQQNNA
jgi:heat-inducible transcriptional repressor